MSNVNDGIDATPMSAEDLIATLKEQGNEPVNGAYMAGRIKEGVSCTGMHPEGIGCVYDNGGIFDELAKQLPKAICAPSVEFGKAASDITPENSPLFNLDIPEYN